MEKNEKKEKKPYIPPELKTVKITKQANLLCGSCGDDEWQGEFD